MKSKILKIISIVIIINLICINFSNRVLASNRDVTTTETLKVSTTIDDIVNQANKFLEESKEEPINESRMHNLSDIIYNILLAIGIVTAVVVGTILGIKFIISTVEEKANIKHALIGYVIGCIVLFGAFGIWKIVATVLSQI